MRNAVLPLLLLSSLLLTVFLHEELRAGGPPAVPGDPQRIVSLAPNSTETLYALGLGPRVVGVTRFCAYPPEAAAKPRVAGFSEINFEAVLRLRPDLALLPGDKTAAREQLERLGIPVLTLDTSSLTGFFRSVEQIGSATGRLAEADSLIRGFQQALQDARNRARGKGRPRVLFSVMRSRRDPGRLAEIHAVGRDGFFQELIEAAGGENAYRGSLAFPRLSRESILFLDPDVIVDALSGGEEAQEARREWESLESLRAVRNHRLYLLADGADTVPGPRSALTLAKLSALLHPEAP